MSSHDDFEGKKSLKGWSRKELSSCNEGGNSFLGGHCKLSHQEVSKTYNLPEHKHLKITASVHMFDNWDGESIYMKVNDVTGNIFNIILIIFYSLEQGRT